MYVMVKQEPNNIYNNKKKKKLEVEVSMYG